MSDGRPTWVGAWPAGVVRLRGADRVDLLHRLSTQDVVRLARPGASFGTVLANEKGRIVDWLGVIAGEAELLLRTSPGRAGTVREWIERFTVIEDVVAEDVTADFRALVVDGPLAGELVPDPGEGRAMPHAGGLVTRGLPAFGRRLELLVPSAAADDLLRQLERGGRRADAATLERLRLEAGVPSPEHEFRDQVNPLELRLAGVAVSFAKGCYIGQEVLARMDSYDKLARVLMGFEAVAATAAGEGELRLERAGKPLGRASSVLRPSEGGVIGLAVVRRDEAVAGPVTLVGESGATEGRLVDRPFWSGDSWG